MFFQPTLHRATWPADTNKVITVVANETVVINAYIKNSVDPIIFSELNLVFTYYQDNIWQAETSFPIGEYLLKITATGNRDLIIGLTVIPVEEYDHTVLQRTLIDKVDSNNSWKAVG